MSTEPSPSQPTTSPPALTGLCWAWFAAWLIIGAGYALSLLGAASIGLFVLPLPVFATILLARRHASSGLPGLISGLGIPLLYVAYLNRAGPGTICTTITGGGQDCTDEWSPWPWLAAAVILLALGLAAFIARQRHLPRQRTGLRS
jgi:hypothetical protein